MTALNSENTQFKKNSSLCFLYFSKVHNDTKCPDPDNFFLQRSTIPLAVMVLSLAQQLKNSIKFISMDVMISNNELRQRRNKRIILVTVTIVLIVVAIFLLRSSVQTSIKFNSLTVAVVERGDVENTIQASGIIQPEFEETISSPIHSSIQKILLNVGTKINADESILLLDKATTETEYERLKMQCELKRSNINKIRLELGKTYFDMRSNDDIKQLQINSFTAAVENAKRLYKAGGGTKEAIELEELKLKTALIEKKQLEKELVTRRKTMDAEIHESELEATIQETQLRDLKRKLLLAEIKSSRPGVITWVNRNIGAMVTEGEPLAKVADLGSYKVTGTISDAYLDQLKIGMPVIIKINDTKIKASIASILPSVQNGFASFEVSLNEKNSSLYRPNIKVDIFLVTQVHSNVIRVANGAAFKGAGIQSVYLLRGATAIRKQVHTGLSNFDYVEINNDELSPGDKVITSDLSDYNNMPQIGIKY